MAMNTQRHILIVDNDPVSSAALAADVTAAGYAVSHTASGGDAMATVLNRGARVDLLLIDTDLADGDGREIVARLRRRGASLPIIVLAATCSEDDVVWALDAGADDYLPRPARMRELVARLRAQFRAAATRQDADVRIGPAVFRPASRTLIHPDVPRPVRLTEKEAALLARLCQGGGRPVSRQTLLREVWGYSPDVASHTVETHIYRLRRKIEPTPQSPALLVNESGGYRLRLDVGGGGHAWAAETAAAGWSPVALRPPMMSTAEQRVG
jgi:DNA-binding response OmpR family regulator